MNQPQQPQYQQPQQQYQQPQYQQPQYQQPQYQPAPQKNVNTGRIISGIADKLASKLPLVVLILLIVAAVSFLYYFILAIVDGAGTFGSFRTFLNEFVGGISTTLHYCIYAFLFAALHKLIKK